MITLIQQAAGTRGSTGTSLTFNFTDPITAGNSVILFLSIPGNAGTVSASGFTIDQDNSLSSLARGVVLSSHNVAGGNTSITVNYPSSSGAAVVAAEFSGLTGKDISAGNTFSTSTSPTSPNVTTTQAVDLIIGAFSIYTNSDTVTAGTGYTAIAQAKSSQTFSSNAFMEYKTVSSTGSYNATATISTSDFGTSQIVAYKGSTGPTTYTGSGTTNGQSNNTATPWMMLAASGHADGSSSVQSGGVTYQARETITQQSSTSANPRWIMGLAGNAQGQSSAIANARTVLKAAGSAFGSSGVVSTETAKMGFHSVLQTFTTWQDETQVNTTWNTLTISKGTFH